MGRSLSQREEWSAPKKFEAERSIAVGAMEHVVVSEGGIFAQKLAPSPVGRGLG